jgi:hypothetical protein
LLQHRRRAEQALVSQPAAGRGALLVRLDDALVLKVRGHGRTVDVHALVAVGVNPAAAAKSSAWTWPAMRTARAGWRSCAA